MLCPEGGPEGIFAIGDPVMLGAGVVRSALRARRWRLLVGGLVLTTTGALVGVQYADALGGSQPAANQLPTWLAAVTPTGQQGPATLSQLTHSPGYRAARPSVKASLVTGGTTTVSC